MSRFKIISKGTGQTTRVEYDGKPLDGIQGVVINPIVPNEPVSAQIHVAFVDLEIEGGAEIVQYQDVKNGDVVDTE